MKSKTRQDCENAELVFAGVLSVRQANITNPTMLVVGTAGNPPTHNGRPGLDSPYLFSRYTITTLDFDPKWRPDIVGDITRPDKWLTDKNSPEDYDLIHIVQTIEHIPNIFDLPSALYVCLKKNGYVIIDCPWGPKSPDYHGETGSFGDYWRISKDGMRYLFESKFDIELLIDTDANTSCLLKKR